jgi:hypothetical protein
MVNMASRGLAHSDFHQECAKVESLIELAEDQLKEVAGGVSTAFTLSLTASGTDAAVSSTVNMATTPVSTTITTFSMSPNAVLIMCLH